MPRAVATRMMGQMIGKTLARGALKASTPHVLGE